MAYVYSVRNTKFVFIEYYEYELGLNIDEWVLYWLIEMKLNGNVLCCIVYVIFHLKVKYVRKVRNYDDV